MWSIYAICEEPVLNHMRETAFSRSDLHFRPCANWLEPLPHHTVGSTHLSIHQLQVAFDAAEDRLLFRVTTTAQEEFRVFLTRRFVKGLWPLLVNTIAAKVAVKAPVVEARHEVMAFEHEKAVRETDFKTPFQEPPKEAPRRMPLGDAPYLATQGQVRLVDGTFKLTLNPAQGQGIEIGLDDRLMHSMCRLIEQAARNAEWDLPQFAPVQSASASDGSPQGAAPPKRLLN